MNVGQCRGTRVGLHCEDSSAHGINKRRMTSYNVETAARDQQETNDIIQRRDGADSLPIEAKSRTLDEKMVDEIFSISLIEISKK
jgi:hypothetical protein